MVHFLNQVTQEIDMREREREKKQEMREVRKKKQEMREKARDEGDEREEG